jgi:hypothetical protein
VTPPEIEEVYPITDEQRMFLGPWRMTQQVLATLKGPLDVGALERAWSELFERHDTLRTSFLRRPGLARVHKRVPAPFTHLDRPPPSLQLLEADRRRGYGDAACAPLTRMLLCRRGEQEHELLWSYDHVLLDGWSRRVVWRELSLRYEALTRGSTLSLPPPPPFSAYARRRQPAPLSSAETERWRRRLQGFPRTTLLQRAHTSRPPAEGALPSFSEASLRQWTEQHELTLTTLVHGAWALLTSAHCGQEEVAFLHHLADRPDGLDGIEQMLGSCYARSFVRTRVCRDRAPLDWLRELQREQGELASEIYRLSPTDMARYSGMTVLGVPVWPLRALWPMLQVADSSRPGLQPAWQSLETDLAVLSTPSPEQLALGRGSPRHFLEVTVLLAGGLPLGPALLLSRSRPRTVRFALGAVVLYLTFHPGVFSPARVDRLGRDLGALLQALLDGVPTLGTVLDRIAAP